MMRTFILILPILAGILLGWWWFRSPASPDPADRSRADDTLYFREITGTAGIDIRIEPPNPQRYHFPDVMGGGAAFLDYDRDRDLDIFVVNGSANSDSTRRSETFHRLYQQTDNGTFAEVSDSSGLVAGDYGQGVAVGDVNNDGWPDIYVTHAGADQLFLNNRDGTFQDVAPAAGIANPHWGASACFTDVNRDGYLDLFVTNYVDYDPSHPCLEPNGLQDYCSPLVFQSTSDRLFLNVTADNSGGQVTFRDISLTSGIVGQRGTGLGVVSFDANGDDWPDLYVANDGRANHLWINQQDETFREEAILYGAAYDSLGRAQAGMGIAVGDANRDLTQDLLVTHLDGENNALYLLSAGRESFEEASRKLGLSLESFPRTGFGCVLFDLNHDGRLDLAVANGRVKRTDSFEINRSDFWADYREPNQLFLNRTEQFESVSSSRDEFLNRNGVSRALVAGDVDRDGDLDLLVTNLGGPVQLFRNEAPKQGNWLQVEAVDPRYGNRHAYGAKIAVDCAAGQWQGVLNPGTGYLTSHEPVLHFGLGETSEFNSVRISWPDGETEQFPGGKTNRRLLLKRGEGQQLPSH